MAKKIKTVDVNELLGVETDVNVETPSIKSFIVRCGSSYLCEGGFTTLKANAKQFTSLTLEGVALPQGSVVEPLE